MFRYLGLTWDCANPLAAAAGRRFGSAMRSCDDWQRVLDRPGLVVFARGLQPGVNVSHRLQNHGVVLGTLFRPGKRGAQGKAIAGLSCTEQDSILATGGQALVDDHWGRYVAFLPVAGRTCVLRDPSGALPCFRLEHDGVSVAFSWLEDVLELLPGIPVPAVAWNRLIAHIALVSLSGHDTVLEGVRQVLPGERLSLAGRPTASAMLWDAGRVAAGPVDEAPRPAAQHMKLVVSGVVKSWATCYDPILLRLSGGLDSSIVLSCLDDSVGRVTCLNYHSQGSNSDERPYARLAAARAGHPLLELERDGDFRLERILGVARTPLPQNYLGRLGTTRTDADIADRIGARALFTGGGGDQLFFEFRDWWGAGDYLELRGLDGGMWTAAMDAARLARFSVWKTLRLALRQRFSPTGAQDPSDSHLTLVASDALPSAGELGRYQHPSLLQAKSLPLGKRLHLQQLLYPTDNYDPYAREAAPELVNPLLSQPVLEHCLATPVYRLTHGGHGRGLVRMAFADDLPSEIARRRSKGGLEEHVNLILRRNLDFARALLFDGQLVARGVLDRDKLDIALTGRPSAQTAHSVEIHLYLAIEAWLRQMAQ